MSSPEAAPTDFSIHVTFEMLSQARCLPIVRATVAELAETVGWSESETRCITMAVDEALANVIRHAYHGRTDALIQLHCRAGEDQLEIRIRDTGDAPDQSRICARELGCDRIGGLGTHIIRDVMDTVSYESRQDGNWLTATKRLRRKG
ncbi:MAG TPA: ATP-binding protein [Bryobacteraceae bacterium]|nr:ATP-binding protein [Bryobacteraceae bacterium]